MQYNQGCFKMCFSSAQNHTYNEYSSIKNLPKPIQITKNNLGKNQPGVVTLNSKKCKSTVTGEAGIKQMLKLSNYFENQQKKNQYKTYSNRQSGSEKKMIKNKYNISLISIQSPEQTYNFRSNSQNKKQKLQECSFLLANRHQNVNQIHRYNSSLKRSQQIVDNKKQIKNYIPSHRKNISNCQFVTPKNTIYLKDRQKVIMPETLNIKKNEPYLKNKYINPNYSSPVKKTPSLEAKQHFSQNNKVSLKSQNSNEEHQQHAALKKSHISLSKAKKIISLFDSQNKSQSKEISSNIYKIQYKKNDEVTNNIEGKYRGDKNIQNYPNLRKKHNSETQNFKKNQQKFNNSLKDYIQNTLQENSEEFEGNPEQISFNQKPNPKMLIQSSIKNGRLIGMGRFFHIYSCILLPIGYLCVCREITHFTMATNCLKYKIMKSLEVSSRMKHSNIVQILSVIPRGDKLRILQQFGENNLEDYVLKQGGRLCKTEAVKVLNDILQGLSYLHNYAGVGYVHSSLKPTNIIMVNGVAKIQWIGYEDSIISGFMSPEMRRGSPNNKKTDIWSLGVIGYYLIYGFVIGFDQNYSEILKNQLNRQAQNSEKTENSTKFINQKYINFLIKCLCQDQTKRINTAQCIADPLFAQLRNLPPYVLEK